MRRDVRIVLAVLFLVGLAAAAALAIDWKRVGGVLVALRPATTWPTLLAFLLVFTVRCARLRVLAPECRRAQAVHIISVQYFLLRVLPLRTGELSFAVLAKRAGLGTLAEGLVGLVLLRLLDLVVLLLLWVACLALWASAGSGEHPVTLVLAVTLALAGTLCLVSLRSILERAHRWLGGIVKRSAGGRLWPRLDRGLARILERAEKVSAPTMLTLAAMTLLQQLAVFALMWSSLYAVDVHLSPVTVVVGGTLSAVGVMLPVSLVGTFGALEGSWVAGFVLVGVPLDAAVASGLVYSGLTFAYSGLLAAAVTLIRGRRG